MKKLVKQAIALLIDLIIILSDRFREAICSIILDAYNKGGNYVKDDMYTWYMAKVDMFHSSPALAARTDQHNLDYIKKCKEVSTPFHISNTWIQAKMIPNRKHDEIGKMLLALYHRMHGNKEAFVLIRVCRPADIIVQQ